MVQRQSPHTQLSSSRTACAFTPAEGMISVRGTIRPRARTSASPVRWTEFAFCKQSPPPPLPGSTWLKYPGSPSTAPQGKGWKLTDPPLRPLGKGGPRSVSPLKSGRTLSVPSSKAGQAVHPPLSKGGQGGSIPSLVESRPWSVWSGTKRKSSRSAASFSFDLEPEQE